MRSPGIGFIDVQPSRDADFRKAAGRTDIAGCIHPSQNQVDEPGAAATRTHEKAAIFRPAAPAPGVENRVWLQGSESNRLCLSTSGYEPDGRPVLFPAENCADISTHSAATRTTPQYGRTGLPVRTSVKSRITTTWRRFHMPAKNATTPNFFRRRSRRDEQAVFGRGGGLEPLTHSL